MVEQIQGSPLLCCYEETCAEGYVGAELSYCFNVPGGCIGGTPDPYSKPPRIGIGCTYAQYKADEVGFYVEIIPAAHHPGNVVSLTTCPGILPFHLKFPTFLKEIPRTGSSRIPSLILSQRKGSLILC